MSSAPNLQLMRNFNGDAHAFVFDSSGTLHAAFQDHEGHLGYASFSEGTWHQEQVVSGDTATRYSLGIALDDENVMIAFADERALRFARQTSDQAGDQ